MVAYYVLSSQFFELDAQRQIAVSCFLHYSVTLANPNLAFILITSGPTRQYLDPVRYLSNASSGRMGRALAGAAIARGHDVVVISGPVDIVYPDAARVVHVVSTEDMLAAASEEFEKCDGLIGAAAPCDYRPVRIESHKIAKTGQPIDLHLVETDDVVATLGERKGQRWVVGFALETEDHRLRALAKLEKKFCDLMVSNGPQAISAHDNEVEVITATGEVIASLQGAKEDVATRILAIIQQRLINKESN
jgi:phosphopantothenoylcysteine decarboxylase / phosphopantothenate---cysteine ligase